MLSDTIEGCMSLNCQIFYLRENVYVVHAIQNVS